MQQARRKHTVKKAALFILCCLCLFVALHWSTSARTESRVSSLFEYRGYSRPLYDRWTRTSQYVAVRDGTQLAVDIYRPQGATEPLPVIWTYERYLRATVRNDVLTTKVDRELWLRDMIRHGYVVAIADARGTGASFGAWDGPFSPREADDAYDLTEWFAKQPWSSQRVGMFGRSYMGVVQLLAAAAAPPHLKAIFPEMAAHDLYSTVYSGGIYRKPLVEGLGNLFKQAEALSVAAPVDADQNRALLAKATEQHRQNRDFATMCAALQFRNSADPVTGGRFFITRDLSASVERINRSGIGIYMLAGWDDIWSRDAFVWFKNLNVPRRLVIGPWSHQRGDGFNSASEHLRWFDYWLKGIDNGIKDEPPITYYTNNTSAGGGWRLASAWPLPESVSTSFYLQEGRSGSINSANDGRLEATQPKTETGQDTYQVDYSTSSGPATRWTAVYEDAFGHFDMAGNDQHALTYTTPPLTAELEVTGHPVVRLWVTSNAPETDVFVYLVDVSEKGESRYVTEGALKSSHSATRNPPYEFLGLPYHRSFLEDQLKLSGKPLELAFDLFPVSYVFKKGHRLRLSITGADKDNAAVSEKTPPPIIHLLRNRQYASHIVLPIIPAGAERRELSLPSDLAAINKGEGAGFSLQRAWVVVFAVAAFLALFTYLLRGIFKGFPLSGRKKSH